MMDLTVTISDEAAAKLAEAACAAGQSVPELVAWLLETTVDEVTEGVVVDVDGTGAADTAEDGLWFNWPTQMPEPLCLALLDNGDVVALAYRSGRWEGIDDHNAGLVYKNVLSFQPAGVGVG